MFGDTQLRIIPIIVIISSMIAKIWEELGIKWKVGRESCSQTISTHSPILYYVDVTSTFLVTIE